MMNPTDTNFSGIPWKDGGRSRAGADCVGIAWLWLRENVGFSAEAPQSNDRAKAEQFLSAFREADLKRGDVVFFKRRETGKLGHLAVFIGDGRYLHSLAGCESRIENGLTLLRRVGCTPVGFISPSEAEKLCAALADPQLGHAVVLLLVSVVLAAASYAMSPTLSGFKNKAGREGNNALVTQSNPEIPLPDVLGSVVVAGNSVYQTLPDKNLAVDNTPPQIWNQVIILASAPAFLIDYYTGLQIKGISYQDQSFFDGSVLNGVFINPTQDKANAVTGSISSDTSVPSATLYDGAYAVSVPVDVRAQYDRTFPLYGFSGCAYIVGRWFDSTKFTGFNLTCRVKCRKCRKFDANGFVIGVVSSESLGVADGVQTRFKLAHEDISGSIDTVDDGVSIVYTEMSASNQTGDVYSLNRTKGYIEFITPPTAGRTIRATNYAYFDREWSQNPAMHTVYLLTEPRRGKGFDASRIDWDAAVTFRDFCDDSVSWTNANGTATGARYQTNYSIDERKPIQDHIKAILDAANATLFLSNGTFVMIARTTGSSVFSFDTSNILLEGGESTFQAELVDRGPKANRIKLFYSSETNLNSETEAIADDQTNQEARSDRIGNDGVVEVNLKVPAISSQVQAERLAEMYLRESVDSNWVYTWKTNIKGLALQPGDVVDVTHPSLTTAAMLLRIESLEQDDLDYIIITASEYSAAAYS